MKHKLALVYGVPFGTIMEQIGIGSIGAYMRRNGYDVKIFCLEAYDNIIDAVIEYKPDYIGFNTVTINLSHMAGLAKKMRDKLDDSCVFFGGVGASGNIKEVLLFYPVVDYVVYGEGEISVYELIERVRKGESVEGCDGIAYRKDGQIIIEKPRDLIVDLDALAFPARDVLIENKDKMMGYLGSAMLETARGCCADCSFCDNYVSRQQRGAIWRGKSVARVVDELQYLVDELQIKRVHFQDRTFEDPGKLGMNRILEIAEEIIHRGIKAEFSICVRAENWNEDNKYILQRLVEAGLFAVQVGIESGNDETLQLYNKRATIEDNIRIINLLEELHIIIDVGFIMFHPYNTFEELRTNIKFLFDHNLGHIKKNLFTQLELTPHTDLYNKILKDSLSPKTFSGDTLNYGYQDPRIENMIRYLPKHASDNDSFIICDVIHFELNYLLQKLFFLVSWNKIDESYYLKIKESKEEIFRRLAKLNFVYITELFDMAESGKTNEEIARFVNTFDNSPYVTIYNEFKIIRFEVTHKLMTHNVLELR